MLLPIGTDLQARGRPIGNWLLLATNVLMFLLSGTAGGSQAGDALVLDAALPTLSQYITYQFLHGDIAHLSGNMLFLWIFGNAVCDRMGSLAYVLFYLSGGIFAGMVFAAVSDFPLLGASGAIASVTAAFMVLFPRAQITLLLWMVIVTTFQVPAIAMIALKVILWDNIIAPWLDQGQGIVSNVAYSAHIGGYGFGLLVPLLLQAVGALPRNSFDLLAMLSRWRRRQGGVFDRAPLPTARPALRTRERLLQPAGPDSPLVDAGETQRLREDLLDRLAAGDHAEAVSLYARLLQDAPHTLLPRGPQLEIARVLAQLGRHRESAAACERFLEAWPAAAEAGQIHLLLGWLLARYMSDPLRGAEHLEAALAQLVQPAQRELAAEELRRVRAALGDAG